MTGNNNDMEDSINENEKVNIDVDVTLVLKKTMPISIDKNKLKRFNNRFLSMTKCELDLENEVKNQSILPQDAYKYAKTSHISIISDLSGWKLDDIDVDLI